VTGRPGDGSATATTDERLRAAAAEAMAPEQVAPWVGARVGLGADIDAGVATSIRAVRIDARHAWVFGNYAVSVGAGFDGLLAGSDADGASGAGFDVPLLVGARSDGDILRGWLGARGGYQHLSGSVSVPPVAGAAGASGTLTGGQWSAGGVLGLAAGLKPIWVAVELDVSLLFGNASLDLADGTRRSSDLSGVAFVPAGALFTKF
jgi:hypothetical protein